MDNINIGQTIKKLRKQKGITQSQLAKIIKVSPSTIGMYEQGSRKPEYSILLRIADEFGISVDYLLKGGNDTAEDITDEEAADIDDKLKYWANKGALVAFENYTLWNYAQKKELVNLLSKAYSKES